MEKTQQECIKLIEKARKAVMGKSEGVLDMGGDEKFWVMLRWSRPKWDGFETVDVVQIEWYYSHTGERGFEEKRKRSASLLWDVLEESARLMGRTLRIECVLNQRLLNMLINERQYRLQTDSENCLLCHS